MRISVLWRGTKTALGFSQEARGKGIKHTGVRRSLKVPQSTAGLDLDHLPTEQMLMKEWRLPLGDLSRLHQRSAAL